jgi:peptidoglycan/LPS O-acetylase OafA/YrhL
LTYFCIFGIFLGPIAATYLIHAGATQDSVGRNTIVALPTLMAGALCAIYLRRPSSATRMAKSSGLLVFIAISLTAFFVVASYIKHINIYIGLLAGTGFTIALCMLLLSAIIGPKLYTRLLSTQILRRIGIYSYGIYVYHIPLFTFFDRLNLIRPGLANALCKMLSVFIFSALSYELVEKKINSYKSRFKTRFKPDAAVPAS